MIEPDSGRVPDRGQAIPVLIVMVAIAAASAIGVARIGARVVADGRAQTAADAAALAGVLHDRTAAVGVATLNGARVVGWHPAIGDDPTTPATVTVTVALIDQPGVVATARATTQP